MDSRELLVSVLNTLGELVGAHVAASPSSWSRALFWLHNEVEDLDWTVRLYLKPVWGDHFKNEVPSSLLAVCDLPEQVRAWWDVGDVTKGTIAPQLCFSTINYWFYWKDKTKCVCRIFNCFWRFISFLNIKACSKFILTTVGNHIAKLYSKYFYVLIKIRPFELKK